MRLAFFLVCLCAFSVGNLSQSKSAASSYLPSTAESVRPTDSVRTRLKPVVNGILSLWEKADVVCLGEDHGSKNDSDLRIAVVEHPDFVKKVRLIMIESANVAHQDVLDRFIVDGKTMSREELSVVWRDATGAEVWAAPIYEAFLRAVQKANLAVPKAQRVPVLAGDDPAEHHRGKWIREAVARELLNKGSVKSLAIYGSGHCEQRGGSFPGELSDKYPGKILGVSSFYTADGREEGRRLFGLGNEPKLIPIAGTPNAKHPAGKMFFHGYSSDLTTPLGLYFDAIVYFGDIKDMKVQTKN